MSTKTLQRSLRKRPFIQPKFRLADTPHGHAHPLSQDGTRQFHNFANTVPVMLWQSDVNSKIKFANLSALKFLGCSLKDLQDDGWLKLIHPKDRQMCIWTHENAFADRGPYTMEIRILRSDGKYRWMSIQGSPWHDVDGRFRGYIGTLDDVSAKRQASENLNQIVESMPIAVFQVNRQGKIILANAQALRLFGYSLFELLGQPIDMLLPKRGHVSRPPDRDAFFSSGVKRSLGDSELDLYGLHKKGHEIPIEMGLSPVAAEGGPQVVVSIVDISKRKQAELEAQESRMELSHMRRVSTFGELAASLAHELNQPLTAILSNAQTASRHLASPAPDMDEVREILKDIVMDDKRAGDVIRRLRSLLKKKGPEFKARQINDVVNEVTKIMHSDAIIRNARIALDLSPDLPLIYGDDVQLAQVLLNLVLNALDAMARTPVDQRIVQIQTCRQDGENVRISVKDQGHGISEVHVARIFSPFFTTKEDGLGMGLSVTRSIVENHKGRIWVESHPGMGAKFSFMLPVYRPGVTEKSAS